MKCINFICFQEFIFYFDFRRESPEIGRILQVNEANRTLWRQLGGKTGKQVQLALNRKKWCRVRPLIKMYALVHNRTNNKNTPEIKMPRDFLFGPTFVGVS